MAFTDSYNVTIYLGIAITYFILVFFFVFCFFVTFCVQARARDKAESNMNKELESMSNVLKVSSKDIASRL